jgi:metallo-beta-lactamase class B
MSRSSRLPSLAALGLALLAPAAAPAQRASGPIASWPRPTEFPREDRAAAAEHFRKARAYAKGDLFADFALRCVTNPKYPTRVNNEQYAGIVDPVRVFDRLYRVGQMQVSAWALDTSDGIVLFDALNDETEARELLVPALRRMGLDPARVRWVIVTHAHGDHYGGAPFFQKTYGAKVIASGADWKVMEGPPPPMFAHLPAPRRDVTVAEGQVMTFGDTPVTFHVTPGHTVGTLSTIFPVTDRGTRHLVGFYGGVGLPRDPATKRTQIASLLRWRDITRRAGVDAQIGNHPLNDEGLERDEQLLYRGASDPNPYVLGKAMYQNYLGVQEECVRFSLARDGFRE